MNAASVGAQGSQLKHSHVWLLSTTLQLYNEDGSREVVGFATIDQRENPHPDFPTEFNRKQPTSRMIVVAYLAVAPRFQRGGIGRKILDILNEAWDLQLHAWEKQKWGRGTTWNGAFCWYLTLGFKLTDNCNDNFC